ncbi:alcohol dehydrogenase [Amorphoplanes auranticolor]|uniref:Alcohol dehydrogenase n=2 Tax=Actinoplanes auranticolor TaxID=47988 RepID=A0A919SLL5_9ACTN|nr:alcohol dehydrogenase [Actinoplanes auranticolor]
MPALRQMRFVRQGPPEVLTAWSGRLRPPAAGEVVVRLAAAGVNVVDLHQRSGAYRVPLPMVPGIEGSGTVVDIGPGVSGVAAGDRVAWFGVAASYASHCLVPADRLLPVPDEVGLVDAAAVLVQGMTAHLLAIDVVALNKSSTCLVLAASGGVGGLLCQLAARAGATVIAAVGNADKAHAARAAGAAHVVTYGNGTLAAEVRTLNGGVDVVYDGIGHDMAADALPCLRPRGSYVLYGAAGGRAVPLDPQTLRAAGSLFLTAPSLAHYDDTRAAVLRRAAAVFALVADGTLRVRVHASYPLEQAADAHRALESRATIGKILLVP